MRFKEKCFLFTPNIFISTKNKLVVNQKHIYGKLYFKLYCGNKVRKRKDNLNKCVLFTVENEKHYCRGLRG